MDPLPKDGESAAGGEPSRGAAPSSGVVVQVREKKGPLRAAIPYMPFPVAVICLFLNTFVPGLGKELRRRPGRERAPAESFATGAALRVPPDGRAPGLRTGGGGSGGVPQIAVWLPGPLGLLQDLCTELACRGPEGRVPRNHGDSLFLADKSRVRGLSCGCNSLHVSV